MPIPRDSRPSGTHGRRVFRPKPTNANRSNNKRRSGRDRCRSIVAPIRVWKTAPRGSRPEGDRRRTHPWIEHREGRDGVDRHRLAMRRGPRSRSAGLWEIGSGPLFSTGRDSPYRHHWPWRPRKEPGKESRQGKSWRRENAAVLNCRGVVGSRSKSGNTMESQERQRGDWKPCLDAKMLAGCLTYYFRLIVSAAPRHAAAAHEASISAFEDYFGSPTRFPCAHVDQSRAE